MSKDEEMTNKQALTTVFACILLFKGYQFDSIVKLAEELADKVLEKK